jgi:uncharacterized protein YbjT (DUF2867 family)
VSLIDQQRVAIAGASGYIGGRLSRQLLERGVSVRVLGRRPSALQELVSLGADAAVADVADQEALRRGLAGINVAYYLVHSMGGSGNFAERDRQAAHNFREAAAEAGVQRVIYLGGLGEPQPGLSEHLASRLEVANILEAGSVPATVLRAAVIVGAGSASYRMIRDLVNHLPVMVAPSWLRTRCQPIAVDDALAYLVGCLDEPRTTRQRLDIGGPDILSYQDMLLIYARAAGLTRLIVPVPVLTPRLSSYWIGLVTNVPVAVARPLIEGVRSPAVCVDLRIRTFLPRKLQRYEAAVRAILRRAGNA